MILQSGGKVLSGQASLNEAKVTGESVPAMKKVEDNVFSGTIVDNGYEEINGHTL